MIEGVRNCGRWTLPFIGLLGLLGAIAFGSASASADPPLPEFQGSLFFPDISGPADPDEFSWRVNLSPGQELVAVDEHTAVVYNSDGTAMLGIVAEAARDATGADVPTTLVVSEGDVITLVVHDREGNPKTGGAPFAYPVSDGPGFTVGNSTVIVGDPSAEPNPSGHCLVPRLKGLTLRGSKRRLRKAGCDVGAVRHGNAVTASNGRVVRQLPKPGATLPAGVGVDVRLGRR